MRLIDGKANKPHHHVMINTTSTADIIVTRRHEFGNGSFLADLRRDTEIQLTTMIEGKVDRFDFTDAVVAALLECVTPAAMIRPLGVATPMPSPRLLPVVPTVSVTCCWGPA
jgi:hypothetical protein